MDYWNEIKKLEKTTIKTLSRNHRFTITVVDPSGIGIIREETGNPKFISRQEIDTAYRHLEVTGEVLLTYFEGTKSGSYVMAILAKLPWVKVSREFPMRIYK